MSVNYEQLLERVIKDGIEAVMADYDRADEEDKRDGAVKGFNDCRGKTPEQLVELLVEAEQRANVARRDPENDNYWYWCCRALEVEWVCNVVSAALRMPLASHLPTARGAMKAAEIVGVAE